jgi:hypothetical protein
MVDMQWENVPERVAFRPEKMNKVNLFSVPQFFLDVYCLEPGQEQKPHSHREEAKVYYVLEGEGTFRVGEEVQALGPGARRSRSGGGGTRRAQRQRGPPDGAGADGAEPVAVKPEGSARAAASLEVDHSFARRGPRGERDLPGRRPLPPGPGGDEVAEAVVDQPFRQSLADGRSK